ncbi:MAG: DUF4249 family protein [Bacteroidales bacterium]|nr:DUF4249 family protein [Bacteroidales bacterium]
MKTHILFIALLVPFLVACSTDVDLYADYKDVPIIYGLISAKSDTNYIKITRAFCGDDDNPINAVEVAQVYDSSNYPGKLDVFIDELKKTNDQQYQFTGRRFYLDTLTIHNKKEGLFYSPHQKLYYTTERFNTKNGNDKYRYKLYVVKPDADTVTSETNIVDANISVGVSIVNFQSAPSDVNSRLIFSSTEDAVLYEIGMRFYYWEGHPGQPFTKKEVSWSFGIRPITAYERVEGTTNLHWLYYSVNSLFNVMENAIGNDTVWDENHPNVIRYIDDFVVSITAAGEDLHNYYQTIQEMQNGLNQMSSYSNIKGGYGLFSSYILVSNTVRLSSGAKHDLFRKPWGFRER